MVQLENGSPECLGRHQMRSRIKLELYLLFGTALAATNLPNFSPLCFSKLFRVM